MSDFEFETTVEIDEDECIEAVESAGHIVIRDGDYDDFCEVAKDRFTCGIVDLDVSPNDIKQRLLEIASEQGITLTDESKSYDEILGPIPSDDIIRHLEGSIEAMVIRGAEYPTDELCEVFLTYLDKFQYMPRFIRLMRQHGVMMELIVKEYIDDMIREDNHINEVQ